MPTVKIIETRYLTEDIHDGDVPRDNTREIVWACADVADAVDVLLREGLTFAATGTDWAANPDGSYTEDYAVGLEVETSGHLYGWSAEEEAAIIAAVG